MTKPYQLEYSWTRASDGSRRSRVGITFNGQWLGYYYRVRTAMIALTIRGISVEQARADILPFFPGAKL